MKLVKKIKSLIFINRPETKNKWWHRLSGVVFYGGAFIIMISVPVYKIINEDLKLFDTEITSFSFSPDYQISMGKIINCLTEEMNGTDMFFGDAATCGDKKISTVVLMQAFRPETKLRANASTWELEKIQYRENVKDMMSNIGNKFNAKQVIVLNPYNILHSIILGLLAAFTWILILQSILYRAILYVIFGKTSDNK